MCSFNDSHDHSAIDTSTPIYVFVFDEIHLMTQEGFDFQQSVAYKTAEIPCKPTHPNISVSLTLQGKGPVEVDNTFIKFNPKVIYINIIHINTIHFNIVHFNIIHSNIIHIKLSKMMKLINQIFHEDFFPGWVHDIPSSARAQWAVLVLCKIRAEDKRVWRLSSRAHENKVGEMFAFHVSNQVFFP